MSLKLFACGDIKNSTATEKFIDKNLLSIVSSSDFSICNLEAPIEIDRMIPINKAGPHLSQPRAAIRCLKNVGFNLVSLANNHIFDYGQEALSSTINELQRQELDFIGGGNNFNEAYKPKIIRKNGIKIGLIAGAENEFGCLYEDQNRGGYAWIFHSDIEDSIRDLKEKTNCIVFIAHAGVENINFPIKEWRERYKRLCDVGVDVVIGHHPHVPQGYEKYNNSLIFYSLGNFYFNSASFSEKSNESFSVLLEFEKNGLKNYKIVNHKMINGQTCSVDEDEVSFSISKLNNLLKDNYEKRNNEICLKLFSDRYYSYYENALGKIPRNYNFPAKTKFILKKLIYPKKMSENRNLLLLHNIRIDTHRFVVQRALSLIGERI